MAPSFTSLLVVALFTSAQATAIAPRAVTDKFFLRTGTGTDIANTDNLLFWAPATGHPCAPGEANCSPGGFYSGFGHGLPAFLPECRYLNETDFRSEIACVDSLNPSTEYHLYVRGPITGSDAPRVQEVGLAKREQIPEGATVIFGSYSALFFLSFSGPGTFLLVKEYEGAGAYNGYKIYYLTDRSSTLLANEKIVDLGIFLGLASP